MGYIDFNPICSVCGETLSCDDIIDPSNAPVCDGCAEEEGQEAENITSQFSATPEKRRG